MNELNDFSVMIENINSKILYYNTFFKKYGFKKVILDTLNPVDIKKSEELLKNIQKDKDLLLFLIDKINNSYGKDGLIIFYNSLFFNIKKYIESKLDIENIDINWDEEVIKKECNLNVYIDDVYYGYFNILDKTFYFNEPKELEELNNEITKIEKEYNQNNDKLQELYEIIQNPAKPSIARKLKILTKDPLEEEKKEYKDLLTDKCLKSMKLDELKDKYEKLIEKNNKDKINERILSTKIKENLRFKVKEISPFPEIDTYNYSEPIQKIQDIEGKFKYN